MQTRTNWLPWTEKQDRLTLEVVGELIRDRLAALDAAAEGTPDGH